MTDYPEWVLKHKKKGTYINKAGDKYYLYAAHSERIKGTNKVRRVSDGYLGRITEEDGLIPPRDTIFSSVITYELGFSYALIACTPKILSALRRSFKSQGDFIYICSILSFMYGCFSKELFESSYLHFHFPAVSYPDSFSSAQLTGIERGCRMISGTASDFYGDDLLNIRAHFSNIRLIQNRFRFYLPKLTPYMQELSCKYSIDWRNPLWQK